MSEAEMAGPRHQHPPSMSGEIRSRWEPDGQRLYIDRADDVVIISNVLLDSWRAGDFPCATVAEPDVVIFGSPMFTITITAENGIWIYRANCMPCGCAVALLQRLPTEGTP